MTNFSVLFISLILSLSPLSGFSQSLQTINLEEIQQRKVRRYIENRRINHMQNFDMINASWNNGTDKSAFQFREKTFFLKNRISHVWEGYSKANPSRSWNGNFVRFSLLISKRSNSVVYSNNTIFPEIDTGQVYFLDLRLLRGLFNLPIAFEIINIDPVLRLIEFSYIESNKSKGKQSIQFYDNGERGTRITHQSYFKSNSALRDNLFYPYFHRKFIREFHRNMKHIVQGMPIRL